MFNLCGQLPCNAGQKNKLRMCVRVFVIAIHECKSSVSSTSLFIDVINKYRPIRYSYQGEIDTLPT